MAAALIQAAWNVGLQVPEDVAVVGFDDTSVAMQISPQLTTVRQPVSHVAGTATYLAACAAVGQEPETASWQVVLPVQFVVRESCGAAAVGRHAPEEPENAAASSEQAESGAAASPARIRMRQLEALNNELLETLYVASHDLRAPLVTINGFADVLDRKFGDALGGRGKATLSRIRRSGETMAQLLEALLNLSRSHHRPLTLQPIPLARVVQSALRDLEGQISSRGAEVWVSPDLPEVIGDELALHQVFLNLVGNAIKYADAGSQPQVRIGYVERAEEHEFSVEDNGSGIPPGLHERVFQPFQRGPGTERTEGLGIGLSIVKGIVLRHGGRIWVESEPENGAVFRFTLPRRPVTAGDKDGTAAVRSHAGAGIVE
jgi:signal transduction histidine kinase